MQWKHVWSLRKGGLYLAFLGLSLDPQASKRLGRVVAGIQVDWTRGSNESTD